MIHLLYILYIFSFNVPNIPRDTSKTGINCPMLLMKLKPRKIR